MWIPAAVMLGIIRLRPRRICKPARDSHNVLVLPLERIAEYWPAKHRRCGWYMRQETMHDEASIQQAVTVIAVVEARRVPVKDAAGHSDGLENGGNEDDGLE